MSFEDFWTNKNNPKLEDSEYLYGTRHIIMLAIVVLLAVTLSLIFRKKSEKAKNILFYVFGGVFLFFEIASRVVNLIIADTYTLKSVAKIILPMHICSVMVWVFIVAIFSRKQFLINFSVVGGILATTAFLLYPSVGINQVYMSFTCIYSTISHMLGFVCCILLMTLGRANFHFKDIWKTFLCFAVMFLWGVFLDFIIFPGSNYMYIVKNPLPINFHIPYQIIFLLIIIAYISIYYVIYTLTHRKRGNA